MTYQCPLCQTPLTASESGLACTNQHQFDRAKEGYIHLMPVQHKGSKNPGDSTEMMQARRAFLNGDYYHPMREAASQLLIEHIQGNKALDIGCGEGYYTHYFADALLTKSKDAQTYGLDISKVAVRYGAKRYPNVDFCVASSYRLPFAENSLNALVRIYAPCEASEMQRVLAQDGILITVTPAARHLYQLRERVYPSVRLHDESAEEIAGFELISSQKLSYDMSLKDGAAFNLLQMTPFAWKASNELRDELKSASLFHCEADFMLRVYRLEQ